MSKILLPGYDTVEFSEEIELPSLEEMLRMPFLMNCHADEAYKYGGDHVRYLLDKAPLKHDKKGVVFRCSIQYLKPGWGPVQTDSWHCDGANKVITSGDRLHILAGGPTTLLTEFLEHPVYADAEIETFGLWKLAEYFDANAEKLGFKPKKGELNKYMTFTSRHPHRVGRVSDHAQFRFFVEVRETDFLATNPYEQAKSPMTKAWNVNHGEPKMTIEQLRDGEVYVNKRY